MPFLCRMRAVGAVLIVVLWSGATGIGVAATDEPAQFVKALGERAIAVLTAEGSTPEARRAQYRELLDEGFAVNTIGRFVLGRYWRAATPEERDEYLRLFRDFVLDTYSQRLDGYAGETFEVIKSRPLDEQDTMVSTEIRGSTGPSIHVDYRVRTHDGTHQIVDVLVEGISLLVTQRAEFASVINREGFEGLLARLREYGSGDTVSN